MKISFKKAIANDGYILACCEKVFSENNSLEPFVIEGLPIRMAFESIIWDIGEQLRTHLNTIPKNEMSLILLNQIIEVIKTDKYRTGRESFVMLMHFFKGSPLPSIVLEDLLYDSSLYGYSVREMNKMKYYIGGKKIAELYDSEKTSWIKKELKINLERSQSILGENNYNY